MPTWVKIQLRQYSVILFLAQLALLIGSANALASSESNQPLAPFKAHYKASFDMGLSIEGTATRELVQQPDGGWKFSQNAKAMIATIEEHSEFTASNQQLTPQRYRYFRKVLGKKRRALLTFDWSKNQVTNDVQDKPWKLAIPTNTLDKLNYQLQLSLDLKHGKKELSYHVADGGTLKQYRFDILGKEELITPLGTLKTIKVRRMRNDGKKRDTIIWFAESMNYMLVKLSQTDNKGKRFNLIINQIDTTAH